MYCTFQRRSSYILITKLQIVQEPPIFVGLCETDHFQLPPSRAGKCEPKKYRVFAFGERL
jgi:hypothetical protein